MGVNDEYMPLGGNSPAPPSRTGTQIASLAMGALLFCSASLNVAQFVSAQRPGAAQLGEAQLGSGSGSVLQHALGNGNCNQGLVHMCVDAATAAGAGAQTLANLGQVDRVGQASAVQGVAPEVAAAAVAAAGAATDPAAAAAADAVGANTIAEAGVVPGQAAVKSATGGSRYCRKDTWLLSCLFYKADVNDELTDWKSVKSECDREPLCDGVNKYWTSDLWHISSSGEAPGCDGALRDGYGTDASAFYKEGSPGWNAFVADNSCHEVDEWGNPRP